MLRMAGIGAMLPARIARTSGLDRQTRNQIWEFIRALSRDERVTVFFTTHYMEEAERVADHIAVIDHGRIVAEGTAAALQQSLRLALRLCHAATRARPTLSNIGCGGGRGSTRLRLAATRGAVISAAGWARRSPRPPRWKPIHAQIAAPGVASAGLDRSKICGAVELPYQASKLMQPTDGCRLFGCPAPGGFLSRILTGSGTCREGRTLRHYRRRVGRLHVGRAVE
jgi:hypothetical protein